MLRILLVAALAATWLPAAASAATFTVNTTTDGPDATPGDGVCLTTTMACTLRAAIQEANTTAAVDTVAFGIAGAGVRTLRPTSALPVVSQPVILDGFTQPGSQPNTSTTGTNAVLLVELDLSLAAGMVFDGGNSTVRGLVVNRAATSAALEFRTRGGNAIEGCFIGTDASGTAARPNSIGVNVSNPEPNRIGGTAAAQRNLISGNISEGIRFSCIGVFASCHTGDTISGNLIGTNAAGTAAVPNGTGMFAYGVRAMTVAGNVVSGNGGAGISLQGPGDTSVTIAGNRIGTTADGLGPLGNGSGLSLSGDPCPLCGRPVYTVGGPAGAANVIAFNGQGIAIQGGQVTISDNTIRANTTRGIATYPPFRWEGRGDIARNTIEANGGAGIDIDIGAFTVLENVVATNGGAGVLVRAQPVTGFGLARLSANRIHDNAVLGIDLSGDGPTPNDTGDGDSGPNNLQNFPVLATACSSGTSVTVCGSLNSEPSSSYTVELFRNLACDASGHGEGGAFLGATSLATGADGNAAFVSTHPGAVNPGEFITATASSQFASSEFSVCVPVTAATPPPAQSISGPLAVCQMTPFVLRAVPGADSYQWFLNGTPIPGATGTEYGKGAAAPADAGSYTVRASNCGLASTSAAHPLSVVPCAAFPLRLDVDRHAAAGTASDLNGILEPSESVLIEPRYQNVSATAITLTGSATLSGLAGGVYELPDATASYGTVPPAQLTDCFGATGDCYRASVSAPSGRPLRHWDALFQETTSGGNPPQPWPLHVGETFDDVPRAHLFYRFIEALVHTGVTGGCSATDYCPGTSVTREQMAVFVLAAREGPFYAPPACEPAAPRFADVPATSAFCRWIEELARRGVVAGCEIALYCPSAPVRRDQMAVFVLATREPPGYSPPACVAGSEMFADVPASSPFCRWVEELARRGVVGGCGNGNYCPTAAVARGEMSVFIAVTFGLLVYGP